MTRRAGAFSPACSIHRRDQAGQRRLNSALPPGRGPMDGRRRHVGRHAVGEQVADHVRQPCYAHVNDQRSWKVRERRPIEWIVRLIGSFMSGNKSDGARIATMGQRNAGVSRRAQRSRHARHDFVLNAGLGQRFGLFAAASKNERIAALETDYAPAGEGGFDQPLMDVVNSLGMTARQLVAAEELRLFRRERQEPSGTRRSYSTKSACTKHSTARRVSKPGLPGPAPTRATGYGGSFIRRPWFAVREVDSS